LVVVLSVHVSFGSCIVCPCFFWSLYCLSMFLTKRNINRQYNNQKKHARNMDRQYNYQKKHGQTIQRPK
jgi:hypothetical protein